MRLDPITLEVNLWLGCSNKCRQTNEALFDIRIDRSALIDMRIDQCTQFSIYPNPQYVLNTFNSAPGHRSGRTTNHFLRFFPDWSARAPWANPSRSHPLKGQPTRTSTQQATLDDHSKAVPPLPIPNRTVKRLSADDSGCTSVKVGHRQALTPQTPVDYPLRGFVFYTHGFMQSVVNCELC